jgi:transposase
MNAEHLPSTVKELRELLLATHQQVKDARRAAAIAHEQTTELATTIDTQREQLEKKDRQILELLQALRGKQRERVDPNQLLLFEIGELEQLLEEQVTDDDEATKPRRRKRQHGRRLIPDNLPREEVVYELPEDERRCPIDGDPMPLIRYETSEQLEYEPATLKVIVHKRAVYACPQKHDEAKLITTPKPPQPIEKGLAGPGLLAAMVVGKFGDHLPGYRLEDILSRHGVEIRRSTIYDWLSAVADLAQPLYDLMKQRALASKVIHTDDTQVKLIDTTIGGTRLARFWAYIGDRDYPYEVYDFTESRGRAGPQEFLKDFNGYLQADAYGGYDGIYLQSNGVIVEVACWAHTRRYWYKAREQDAARAHHVLAIISRLYELERATKNADAASRQKLRVEHAAPLLDDLKQWLDDQEFLPKSLTGKAATYTRNQWAALNRYLEDGDLSIDNNAAERAMKPVAIGRKNWLFVGSPRAGRRAAILMSLIASCKANHVEPWAWLRDVLTHIPRGTSLEQLLPDKWLQTHPQHRWTIADRRKQERTAKGNL